MSVQNVDSAIQLKIVIQWITIRESNCIIQRKEMYPVDIITLHLLTNWSLHVKLTCILSQQHAQRVEASQAMM